MTASTTALAADVAEYIESQASMPLRLVDVGVEHQGSVPVVRGTVLTPGQGAALRKIAERHAAGLDIQVIGDPVARLEQAWLKLSGASLEVWRDPGSMGQDQARATEYLAIDGALRLLGRLPGAMLVQGPDLTIGWIDEAGVVTAEADASRADWEHRVRAAPGHAIDPDPAIQRPDAEVLGHLLAAGREALDTPYRWGGTTAAGYDCSGLVQRLFSLTTGILLPKHTGDQRHVGARVVDGERRAGDLLFATPIGQKVGHVMLVTSPDSLLHACRTEQRVIEERLEDNAKRYQHQGYRRPVQLP
ncbi:MAG TPA: C40 family peptidase [Candidatus Dormibacteraeota bacterium]|jgi:cell wall-associated NlpC family hydrolase|nr:C40 family peptidase [Candidatus Dormibacteraeota bacterium]